MKMSKTTLNYAAKRGIALDVNPGFGADDADLICFDMASEFDSCEWAFSYRVNADGTLSYNGNIWLPKADKEELPAMIRDEKHLRQVIDFIAPIMAATFNR